MTIAGSMLTEFEQEARTTRRFLERLPEEKLAWRPHEKSMSAGQLALHIASVPAQVVQLAREDEVAAPDFNRLNPQPGSLQEVLDALDRGIVLVREVLPTFEDDRMQATWTVKQDGKKLLSMPRAAFLRSILLNHWYHHRGQFGVYLRLAGAKVPASYGPSADELPEFLQGEEAGGG
jgi:uncharacterized damage-inducible protein DinB